MVCKLKTVSLVPWMVWGLTVIVPNGRGGGFFLSGKVLIGGGLKCDRHCKEDWYHARVFFYSLVLTNPLEFFCNKILRMILSFRAGITAKAWSWRWAQPSTPRSEVTSHRHWGLLDLFTKRWLNLPHYHSLSSLTPQEKGGCHWGPSKRFSSLFTMEAKWRSSRENWS